MVEAKLSFTDPDVCSGGMGAGVGTPPAPTPGGEGMAQGGGSGSARPSCTCNKSRHWEKHLEQKLPSRGLTYPPKMGL